MKCLQSVRTTMLVFFRHFMFWNFGIWKWKLWNLERLKIWTFETLTFVKLWTFENKEIWNFGTSNFSSFAVLKSRSHFNKVEKTGPETMWRSVWSFWEIWNMGWISSRKWNDLGNKTKKPRNFETKKPRNQQIFYCQWRGFSFW